MEDLKDHIEFRESGSDRLSHPLISCEDLFFSYGDKGFSISFENLLFERGSKSAIVGPSGCGKTTLIQLISGILQPDRGNITIDEVEITRYTREEVQDFRILKMGLIFQQFALLEYLTVLDNVLLPYRINPVLQANKELSGKAHALLTSVGLGDKAERYPGKLSQGERQRVAVCRALITGPDLLLCDEPTANLDQGNRDKIMDIIFSYCNREKKTLLMVTHDETLLPNFDRVIRLDQRSKDHYER